MVWTTGAYPQDFVETENLPYNPLPVVPSPLADSSSVSGIPESIVVSSSMDSMATEYLHESFLPTTTSYLLNGPDCDLNECNPTTSLTSTTCVPQYTVDDITALEKHQWQTDANVNMEILDNARQNMNEVNPNTSLDTDTVFNQINGNRPTQNSRERKDSSSSCNSNWSGEIFNSQYIDTISSVESTSFLLKPSSDSEEEPPTAGPPVKEIYFNDVYMSCSSSEMLNETESDEETTQCLLPQDSQVKTETLVEGCTEEKESESCGNEKNLESHEDGTSKPDSFVPHSLFSIDENQVITFNVEEVQPSESYVKITNNIISADESFLLHSNPSLWDLESGGKNGKRAFTMQNLHERNSFLDLTETSRIGKACQKALLHIKDDISFGSLASLNKITSKQIEKESGQALSLISDNENINIIKSSKHTRNLLALSVCLTLLYIAIGSVRNLQSSINHEGGVGVLSMATNCVGFLFGSLFSASVVLSFQPRRCIIINLIPNLVYVAANIYPTIWIMMPISFIQGLSMAIIWNAVSTYVVFLSRGRSHKKGEEVDQVSSRFFGILCLMYQSHLIIGNLIASLVLMPGGGAGSNNETDAKVATNISSVQESDFHIVEDVSTSATPAVVDAISSQLPALSQAMVSNLSATSPLQCGSSFTHLDADGSGFAVSMETKYFLFSIYIGCIIFSILIAVLLIEPLNPRLFTSTVKPIQKLKSQLSSLIVFAVDVKFLLLIPMLMYSAIQFAFIAAEFTKAFVTCSLGIHMVGYTMICLGVCGGLSSYLGGLLNQVTGRIPIFLLAAASNLGLLIYMKQWEPSPDSLIPFFVIMGLWGIGDGIWISQVNSLMGSIFPLRYEEAYAGLRIIQGLGPAISYGYSASVGMDLKIYIMIALCIVSTILYLIMEALLRRKGREKMVFTFKQTSV